MRRLSLIFSVVLGLIAICVVAMVRAQDAWNLGAALPESSPSRFSGEQEALPLAGSGSTSPNQIARVPFWQGLRRGSSSQDNYSPPASQTSPSVLQKPTLANQPQEVPSAGGTSSAGHGPSLAERFSVLRGNSSSGGAPAAPPSSSSRGVGSSEGSTAESSSFNNVSSAVSGEVARDQELPSVLTGRGSVFSSQPSAASAAQNEDSPVSSRRTAPYVPSAAPSFDAGRAGEALPTANSPSASSSVSSSIRNSSSASIPPAVAAAADGILFTSQGPSLKVQTSGSRTIVIGKESLYRVGIVNDGAVGAKDVIVSVHLPPWVEVAGSSASTGSARFEAAGNEGRLKWAIAVLPGGQREELTLKLISRESRPFDLAVAWTMLPVTSLAQVDVLEPKLEMTLFGPKEVLFGETKVYTISLSNPGTGDAENVQVNLLPIGGGQEVAGASKIGTLKAGGRKVIEIELTARQAGTLDIRAQATADGGLKAGASEEVLVRRANLQLAVDGPGVKYAGTVTSYQVRVTNAGNATAESVLAYAVLPRDSKYISSTEGGGF